MSARTRPEGGRARPEPLWRRALASDTDWQDKEEFLDVIYWARQAIGIILGLCWGVVPLKGLIGLILFVIVNAAIIYLYVNNFQNVDEEEFGGMWEITKEGFMTSFAGFLLTCAYSMWCNYVCWQSQPQIVSIKYRQFHKGSKHWFGTSATCGGIGSKGNVDYCVHRTPWDVMKIVYVNKIVIDSETTIEFVGYCQILHCNKTKFHYDN